MIRLFQSVIKANFMTRERESCEWKVVKSFPLLGVQSNLVENLEETCMGSCRVASSSDERSRDVSGSDPKRILLTIPATQYNFMILMCHAHLTEMCVKCDERSFFLPSGSSSRSTRTQFSTRKSGADKEKQFRCFIIRLRWCDDVYGD